MIGDKTTQKTKDLFFSHSTVDKSDKGEEDQWERGEQSLSH